MTLSNDILRLLTLSNGILRLPNATMNSEKLNNTGDRSKSQEIPEETKNDLHNRRTLSLFNAGADLISQLTVFAADHSINKQSTKQNGLTATDPSNLSSLQSPLENHLVEVEVRAKSASSPKVDFDSPPPQAELIEDGTTENGLKGPQCCSCQVSFEDRNSQVCLWILDPRLGVVLARPSMQPN